MNEPMNLSSSSEALPAICRFLRAKTGYGTLEGGENPWLLLDTSTAVHWCLCTMTSCGPDDEFAHSDVCHEGRGCFMPPRKNVEENIA
jgi:hypothetical protein